MTKLFNKTSIKSLRSSLRRNQTQVEQILWQRIRNKQINNCRFLRQYSIGKYIVDFYCPKQKIIIELDGSQHNEILNKLKDNLRSNYFKSLGLKELRFWDNEVLSNIEGILEKILININPS